MDEVIVKVDSEVNEIFMKTIVTQEATNISKTPIELTIIINKKPHIIFDSFEAKIGDSIMAKSKVISKEKAEVKYTDAIASGNAAIYVIQNDTEDKITVQMGNIPPNEKVIFISEFIQNTEYSTKYECELFKYLPIFKRNYSFFPFKSLEGKLIIKSDNEIIDINDQILMEDLKITEQKYLDESKKNEYMVKYEINKKIEPASFHLDYIPCSKIFFNFKINSPVVFCQKLSQNSDEKIYILQHINKIPKKENEEIELNPSLFIFLLDQSGSMSGKPMKIACQALKLFLQSLPKGSYYQIIGFGSKFTKYENEPVAYLKNNIIKSIENLNKLKANLGGTDIYSPLKDIFDSKNNNKINLPKNIFLLTDGEIKNKSETLKLIEDNNSIYRVYSIGVGNSFDKDLIKNMGLLGKGNYNFCTDIDLLNEIITTEIRKATSSYVNNFGISSPELKNENIINKSNIQKYVIDNQMYRAEYILKDKEKQNFDKINIEIKYNYKQKEVKNNYIITPIEIPEGNSLFKLVYNKYILENSLQEKDIRKLALKYQIFTKYTSLFAEIELSNKTTEQMQVIYKDLTTIYEQKPAKRLNFLSPNILCKRMPDMISNELESDLLMGLIGEVTGPPDSLDEDELLNQVLLEAGVSQEEINNLNKKGEQKNKELKNESKPINVNDEDDLDAMLASLCGKDDKPPKEDKKEEKKKEEDSVKKNEVKTNENIDKEKKEMKEQLKASIKIIKNEQKKKEEKENTKMKVMEIINTQDFLDGFWTLNEKTKSVKNIYEREYKKLIELKKPKLSENVVMTILIIYYINKKHSELLKELDMIITKAKNYIKTETKYNYKTILSMIGIK